MLPNKYCLIYRCHSICQLMQKRVETTCVSWQLIELLSYQTDFIFYSSLHQHTVGSMFARSGGLDRTSNKWGCTMNPGELHSNARLNVPSIRSL